MNLEMMDQAADAVSTDVRVSRAMIDGQIMQHWFTTADQCIPLRARLSEIEPLKLMTLCFMVMKNGYVIIGKSACAAPKNFNAELGRKLAFEDCIRQLYPLLGYELKSYIRIRDGVAGIE